MKYSLSLLALVGLCGVSALYSQEAGQKEATAAAAQVSHVALKAADVGDSSSALAKVAAGQFTAVVKPSSVQAPRSATMPLSYFQTRIGQTDLLLGLEYNATGSKLYIDTSGSGDLSQGRPLGAVITAVSSQAFPAIPVKGANGEKTLIRLEALGPKTMLFYPATVMAGTVKLDGKTYSIFLLDANLNGAYNDLYAGVLPKAGQSPHDFLGIDLNNNRRFDRDAGGVAEVMPVPKSLRIGGNYYKLTVAADGTSLELEKMEQPPVGSLDVGASCADLVVYSENGAYHLSGASGKWDLPAGKFAVGSIQLLRKDRSGATWMLDGKVEGKFGSFDVTSGQTTSLKLGPPLEIKVDVKKSGSDLALGVNIYGQGDESYGAAAYKNGVRQSPPKIKIVDEAGNVVLNSTSFSFG